jgi:uncharacterized protein (TIGR00725 family)
MNAGKKIIAVLGGGECDSQSEAIAEQVGRFIAERHGILICGGMYGVMAGACRGAKEKGGLTIGILPGKHKSECNDFVDVPIVTGMADARNVIIARSADAAIAIDGEMGTLSEIAFCLKFGVPVIGLQTWSVHPDITHVDTPEEAVERAFSATS